MLPYTDFSEYELSRSLALALALSRALSLARSLALSLSLREQDIDEGWQYDSAKDSPPLTG